jgi:hypothetical protein
VIPPFRKITGALPPGIHEASWEEFILRYGYNRPRRHLLRGLEQVIADLRAAGCRRIYVDGSFIMDKPEPGDFDCCWEEVGVSDELLPNEFFDIHPPRRAQLDRYGGEIFPAHWAADLQGTSYVRYFQRDTRTGLRKGIIAINL